MISQRISGQALASAAVLLLIGVAGGHLATGSSVGHTAPLTPTPNIHTPVQVNPGPALSAARSKAPPVRSAQEIGQDLETALMAEGRDSEWSVATEQAIAGVITSPSLSHTDLIHAHCGATMCQIVLSHGDDEAREAFLDAAPELSPFNTSGLMYETEVPGASLASVLIFAREGYALAE